MVGMKGAKNIIAINKDKEAPIFGIADLGIVGDVHKVLPKLIEALQARGLRPRCELCRSRHAGRVAGSKGERYNLRFGGLSWVGRRFRGWWWRRV